MKRFLFFILTLMLVSVLQISIFSNITVMNMHPDLFLILSIYFGMMKGKRDGMNFGFFGGLLEDIFILGPFGANAVSYTIFGFISGEIKGKVIGDSIVPQSIIIFLFSLVHYVVVYFLRLIFYTKMPFSPVEWIIYAGYNGIIGPLIFIFLSLWVRLWRIETSSVR